MGKEVWTRAGAMRCPALGTGIRAALASHSLLAAFGNSWADSAVLVAQYGIQPWCILAVSLSG